MDRYGIAWASTLQVADQVVQLSPESPDELRATPRGLEKLEALYEAQLNGYSRPDGSRAKGWIEKRLDMGYRLVSTPSRPFYTPRIANDVATGRSWRANGAWVVVMARFKFDGVIEVVSYDDWHDFRRNQEAIGAGTLPRSAGAERWLRTQEIEQ